MLDRRTLLASAATSALVYPVGTALASPAARTSAGSAGLPPPRLLPKPAGTAFFAPAPPVYPVYPDLGPVTARVRELSDVLERHIRAWFAGTGGAEIPAGLLPPGTNTRDYRSFRLVRPEDITADRQWAIRPAEMPMDTRGGYRGFFPDPSCTYVVMPAFLAPFGSRLVIEGQFPHARFFDIQVTPSFDPGSYRYDSAGVGEVPIVDADIEPLPGHQNPFRTGARRDAVLRGYRVEYDLEIGNPVRSNPAFRPPHFRAPGNRRTGGAILFRGPWGMGAPGGDGRGAFAPGEIWIRYYRPDDGVGPQGGVPLPKAWCELPTGERFWIAVDFAPFSARINRRDRPAPLRPSPPRIRARVPMAAGTNRPGSFARSCRGSRATPAGRDRNTSVFSTAAWHRAGRTFRRRTTTSNRRPRRPTSTTSCAV